MTNQQADYLISGGIVVTGDGMSKQDVIVANGLITQVAPGLAQTPAAKVIDATGKYVLPGIIDAHNHPVYADKVDTFSVGAAYGGITTIIPFIRNLRNEGIDGTTVDAINGFIEEAELDSVLDFGVHAILVGDDDVNNQVPQLIKMGVISFKMFKSLCVVRSSGEVC